MLYTHPAEDSRHDDSRHLDDRRDHGFDGRNHFDCADRVPKLR